MSRRPLGRSCVATQTRWSPSRTYNCVLSPVSPTSRASTGRAASTSAAAAGGLPRPSRRGGRRGGTGRRRRARATRAARTRPRAGTRSAGPARSRARGRRASTARARRRSSSTRTTRSRVCTLVLPVCGCARRYTVHTPILVSHHSETTRNASTATRGPRHGQTLSEKVWDEHVVRAAAGEPDLLFIDLHLVHEVTSPQAFDGLRLEGRARPPARPHDRDDGPQRADHRARPPARGSDLGDADGGARAQLRRVRHPLLRDG